MPELLAPAGGMEALRAAVQNGADAVYIGAKAFNARAYADNFDRDELRRAADYCHLRGVLLYITLNTMMLQEEMEEGAEAARQAYMAGADALIVADMGLAGTIHACCPDIPLHASTQMCVHNSEGARIAGKMGFRRAVLARELSLADIRGVTKDSGIETEVFVHGALCSSVSGLCLLSSFIGQRSGNRGKCAQPCRMEYTVGGKDAYYLSMADLCAADLMLEMVQSGVFSFKIEGRMKNSGYVGGVTREYRRILDAAMEGKPAPAGSTDRLQAYYNRTFTNAYLLGGTDVTATDKPGNRNIDKNRADETGVDIEEKVFYDVKASVLLEEGKRPWMELALDGLTAQAAGDDTLPRANKPMGEEIVVRSVGKTGGTPFKMSEITVDIKGNPYISVSGLNHLRKEALGALEDEMLSAYRLRDCAPCRTGAEAAQPHDLREVFVQTGSADAAIECLRNGAGRIYFAPMRYDGDSMREAVRIGDAAGEKPYIVLPPFLRRADMDEMEKLLREHHTAFGGGLAGNFSQITLLRRYFDDVVADYTCNIAGRDTVRAYEKMGFGGVALSTELNKKDINAIKGCLPTEIVAYGHLPLMWLAHPLDADAMTDRRGYEYAIQKIQVQSGLQTVLNPVRLAMREIASVRHSVDAIRLLLEEDTGALPEYIRAVREGKNAEIPAENTTQGHLKRGV